MYLNRHESSTHPDIRDKIAEAASQIEIEGFTHRVGIDQIEVLKQRTYTLDAGHVSSQDERSAVTSCLAQIYGLPPENSIALMLMLASQRSPDSEFLPSSNQASSFPDPPHLPFCMLNIVHPWLGMTTGVKINHPGVRTLRAVLPDGSLREDSVSNDSLLVLIPIYGPDGWTIDEAPTFHLLNQDGDDIIAPGRFPLERGTRPPE